MFRNRAFLAGLGAVFLFYSSISSLFLALTFLLQDGMGLSPVRAGLVFTPCAVAFFAGSRVAAPLALRLGSRAVLVGVGLFACGIALSAFIGAVAPERIAPLVVALALNGAGQGIVIPLALEAVLSGVESEHAGLGAGIVSTMQNVGSAVGVTIVGVIFFALARLPAEATASVRTLTLGHAFAHATIYNLLATGAAFLLFRGASRPPAAASSRPV
jgi:MFS family permease